MGKKAINKSNIVYNELGEGLTNKEISELASRVRKLPEKSIDELWFRLHFIYTEKGQNKAMSPENMVLIKKSQNGAEILVENLFTEESISDIRRELEKIEGEIKEK